MTKTRTRSTFYWAMALMPRQRRAAMFALYDLARAMDDVADNPGTVEAKRAALDEWQNEIGRLYAGQPTHELTRALLPVIRHFDLPRREFEELARGMRMDVDGPIVAPPRQVLDLYCRRVAGTIGRLSLPIFGADGPAEQEFALYLGRALQLTNILRDIHADATIGRLYVPAEYLEAAGITTRDVGAALRSLGFNEAAQSLVADAQAAFTAAEALLPDCNRRALWPALAMRSAYRTLLDRLALNRLPMPERQHVSRAAALCAALRAALFARA
jgi:presqualene diphosphate synthase